jgi:hypothetical protein
MSVMQKEYATAISAIHQAQTWSDSADDNVYCSVYFTFQLWDNTVEYKNYARGRGP